MEACPKSIYAYQKVKSAIRDHEADVDVSVSIPKTRAKVVVVGSSGVGKTSVIYRHRFGDRSAPFTSTIGASFVECEVETSYENISLQIWDTAGQERFRCMVPMYMRNSVAAIIMYDITNRQSFEDVDKWSEELRKCCGIADPVVVLIGNKCDLFDKRRVSTAEGQAKALSLDARFYEISAEKPISMFYVFFYTYSLLCVSSIRFPLKSIFILAWQLRMSAYMIDVLFWPIVSSHIQRFL
ncbi:Ras family protein [Ancylostoma duodenale]|uniref:Ras family protein n=1 Tax=Ancylostoma duodenale TaxID=51022 RepID=A0A0C2HB25_9BILA|nr:Ras family protein [Ancylostoma duodenale]